MNDDKLNEIADRTLATLPIPAMTRSEVESARREILRAMQEATAELKDGLERAWQEHKHQEQQIADLRRQLEEALEALQKLANWLYDTKHYEMANATQCTVDAARKENK